MATRNPFDSPLSGECAPAREEHAPQAPRPERSFSSVQLFAGQTEITILHQDAAYRLKITRQGKLILNK